MDLFRPRTANHANNLTAGCTSHDGIINQYNALPLQKRLHWIQFQLYAEVAHALAGLDEGAANVAVANQAEAKWNSALSRITDRSGNARIWYGNNEVGIHGASRASCRPISSRLVCTARLKTVLSGREK